MKNNSAQDIAGVKGIMQFHDMFDARIENIELSLDQAITAHSERTITGKGIEVNQFKDDDKKLAATDLAKMKVTFVPEMIVFKDGSSEKMPEDLPQSN